jgi:hypothetical protein
MSAEQKCPHSTALALASHILDSAQEAEILWTLYQLMPVRSFSGQQALRGALCAKMVAKLGGLQAEQTGSGWSGVDSIHLYLMGVQIPCDTQALPS